MKQQLELKEKFASIKNETIVTTQNAKVNMPESNEQQNSEVQSQLSISPPPTVSISMPSIGMPLLTPPPAIESSNQSEKNVLSNETNRTVLNSCNLKESLNVPDTEMISQNEDSLMSNSSSATSGVSASNSNLSNKDLKTDDKANKENSDLKRKIDLRDTIETKALTKLLNESSQDSKSDSSGSSSPIKKKKLKINEMEDFMNKPMAPITIVSNQYSNTIQVQFKNESVKQPILIAQPTQPNQQTSQIQSQAMPKLPPQNIQLVQGKQTDQSNNSCTNDNYLCQWNNCNQYFPSAKAVYIHVCKVHLLNDDVNFDPEGQCCMWSGCDQIKRQKWSLINHIQVI